MKDRKTITARTEARSLYTHLRLNFGDVDVIHTHADSERIAQICIKSIGINSTLKVGNGILMLF